MTSNNDLVKRVLLAVLGVGLIAYGFRLQSREPPAGTEAQVRNASGAASESSGPALVKVPIKDLRVGTRVPAFNPEVSAGERRGFTEPNWYRWMKLRLEMPKPDGTMLEIEMLRSEDWLIHNVELVVESQPVMLAGASEVSEFTGKSTRVGPGVPLRAIYGHLVELFLEAAMDGDGVSGMVVELNLPELGLNGPAWIVDLEPSPIIPAGPGQVVTAKFKHASASVLDLVLASTPPATQSSQTALSSSPSTPIASPTDMIGVTANHPFWSVDRAEFVQAGELRIGERLQTLAGDIQWVQQKLPRPGPEPVYNLEVHDEHVYYVGSSGVLAHNAGKKYNSDAYKSQIDQTPTNGTWSGRRGESTFTSANSETLGIKVSYQNGYANLAPHAKYSVEIEDFIAIVKSAKNPRRELHKLADQELAKRLGVDSSVIKRFRKVNRFTWHEVEDMRTLQFVKTLLNAKFGHVGGVSKALGQ